MTPLIQSLITIVLFIAILGILVVIHEIGHFVTARLSNVRVLEFGVGFERGFRSEREDWIMTMVAAGMGICFLPEYSAVHPGIRHRLVVNPEVVRAVSVVSVAGRALPPAAVAFIKQALSYEWPGSVPRA